MVKRRVVENLTGIYVEYLKAVVSGKIGAVDNYENDFIVKTAEAVNNLHNSGYKVE